MKKYPDFFHAVLNVNTQEEANNLNKLFTQFLKELNKIKFDTLLLQYFKSKNHGQDIINFRIYPKDINPRHPSNTSFSFWPTNIHEINGIFNYTKNLNGLCEVYNLVLDNEYDIKKCFIEQNGKAVTHEEKLKCSLLLPNKEIMPRLYYYLIDNDYSLSDYFECIKYNYYIYDLLTFQHPRRNDIELRVNEG